MSASRPVIHYYAVCWNEEYLIPHFLAHYGDLVDAMVILDDGSTDQSVQILRREPKATIRPTNRPASGPYIGFNTNVYNNLWKLSRGHADWVIVGNIDEFIYARDLVRYLTACTKEGVTVVPVLGFEMISRDPIRLDQNLLKVVRRGAPSRPLSRLAIFNPDAIEEINYLDGRHVADPRGDVVFPQKDRVLNLHYKKVGMARTFQRMIQQDKRRSLSERRRWRGFQYGEGWPGFVADWETVERDSIDVFDWYGRGGTDLPDIAWWRGADRPVRAPVMAGGTT